MRDIDQEEYVGREIEPFNESEEKEKQNASNILRSMNVEEKERIKHLTQVGLKVIWEHAIGITYCTIKHKIKRWYDKNIIGNYYKLRCTVYFDMKWKIKEWFKK